MALLNFNKLEVNKKIRLGLGVSLFILLVSSVVSFYSIRSLIEQSYWVDHTKQVILNVENIISAIKDAETGQRGYLITGKKEFLEPYNNAHPRTLAYYRQLRDLTADNPTQQQYLDSLKPVIDNRFRQLAYVISIFDERKVVIPENMQQGRYLMNKARQLINQMKEEESRLLKQRTEEAQRFSNITPIIIAVSSFLALLVAGLSMYFISRDIKNKEKYQQELSNLNQELVSNRVELDRQNYLLAGNARLNDLLRGEKDLHESGSKILDHLCGFMKAQAGVLYIMGEDGRFHLSNTYALGTDSSLPPVFKLGEGLLGQSALERKRILMDNLPGDSIQIKSGLTSINPVNILIVPFFYNDNTVAVIELLNRNNFEEKDLEFIDSIGNTVSIFINNIKAEIKTNQLLAETQNQAEELEAQQAELKHMNDNLREQRDKLQASEEELRASEEELQEKNAELELQYETVRTRNKALEDARQAVQLKIGQVETISKYKSEFLANMSHELRTPLNSILILATLLKENRSKNLSPKEIEQAAIIEKSGNDLLKLINEILDLARVESGKVKLELNEYSISDFNLENQFRDFAREKKILFKTEIDPKVPAKIHTDRFRVEQILKNLLSNAFKFTPEGGTIEYSIRLAEKDKLYSNPALTGKKVIAFSVRDTGIGIPEEKKHLIFEAFQQADASTTRKFGGSGLGLTISRDIAQLLGGEIQVESELGKGSTFTIYLPEKMDDAKARELVSQTREVTPERKEIPVLKQEKEEVSELAVLVIEDDIYFSKILTEYATGKGYKVYSSYTGKEGMELARMHPLKAILLDVQLPDANGWDLLKKLKNDPLTRNIPVHMMSAYNREGLTNDLGQADFIPKPITLEKLDSAFAQISGNDKPLKKVLIIEDNINENLAVQELLKSQDMAAEGIETGKEALELLKRKRFDCVVLDLSLPDLDGFEVLERLKQDPDLKDLPVIIYSGKDLSEEEEARLKKHADTIVIKTEYSYTRLLEEVKLFMHNMDSSLSRSGKIPIPAESGLQDKKVLIADDDMRNIFSLSSVLEDHGMRIIVAYDGKQAIEELEANPDTDIVLMDIMMPEMDGIEATRHIRTRPEFRNLPIIAVTAKAMAGDKEKCLAAGVSDYISKPVDLHKLLSLMRVWIYKS